MENINDAVGRLKTRLPFSYTLKSMHRLHIAISELLILMLELGEMYPGIKNISCQLVPSMLQHVEIAGSPRYFKTGRFHFAEAARQFAHIMEGILFTIAEKNQPVPTP